MTLVPAEHHVYYVAAAYAVALAGLAVVLFTSRSRCRSWRKRAEAQLSDFSSDPS
jgi:hypothetical protein